MASSGRPRSRTEPPQISRPPAASFTFPSPSSPLPPRSWPPSEREFQHVANTHAQDNSRHADSTMRDATGNDNLAASSKHSSQPGYASPDATHDEDRFSTLSDSEVDSKDTSWKDDNPPSDDGRPPNVDSRSRLSSRPASGGYMSPDSAKSGQAHPIFIQSHSYDMVVSPPASPSRSSSPVSDGGHVQIIEPPPRSSRPSSRDGTPLRHDSGCFSARENEEEDPEVDVDTQARNIRARERVQIRRAQVTRTRQQVNESRQEVQSLRDQFRDVVAQLVKVADELMATNDTQGLKALAPYHERVRLVQDQLGPAEQSYGMLEMKLNSEEEKLEQEEHHFYSHNNIKLIPFPEDVLDQELSPLVKPYNPPDSDFQNLDLNNDMVKAYLAKIAEAETLKEEMQRLENKQYRLIQEETFRNKHNLQLSEESLAFLNQYPDIYEETVQNLQVTENELYALRERCIADDLFSESEYRYEPRDALIEEIDDEIREAHYRNPLFAAAAAATAGHFPDPGNKQRQINTWILQMVTDSSVEWLRLLSFIRWEYHKAGKSLDDVVDPDWSKLVINLWNSDDLGGDELELENKPNSSYDLLGASSFADQDHDTVGLTVGSEWSRLL
ncbi:hypothetical protein B7463_g5256, partial [Scytalidium lignicola]